MATFIKPTVIAEAALATLYNTLTLGALVHRDFDADFAGKVGDTVNVRTPASFVAKEFVRANGIELQDATETSVPVRLDTILDVSFPVTSEDLTLNIDDFEEQLLTPAMEAIVQDIDLRLAKQLLAAARGTGGGGKTTGATSATQNLIQARTILSRNKIPLIGRNAMLSPEASAVALSEELWVAADKAGTTDGLREAIIGRAFGFSTYETNGIDPAVNTNTGRKGDGVAFHRDAVTLVTRTLEKPMGVAQEQFGVANYKGMGLRVVQEYDVNKKQDVVSIDFLLGVKTLRPAAAVELDFPPTNS